LKSADPVSVQSLRLAWHFVTSPARGCSLAVPDYMTRRPPCVSIKPNRNFEAVDLPIRAHKDIQFWQSCSKVS
jgi:hypothetical protein